MKNILITTIAAVLVVGCGEAQQLSPLAEAKPVAEAAAHRDSELEEHFRGLEQEGKEFMDKILSSPSIANVDESDFVGDYFYEMTLPENNKETGKVIVIKYNSIYYLQWTRDDGPVYTGIGIRKGNVLSVCYSYSLFTKGERGVSIYWISDEKEISGEWTILGDTATDIQTDKWKRIK